MKRRPLLLGYFILTLGFAAIFMSATFTDGDKSAVKNETATDYLISVRNNQVTGQIDPADYLKAVRQVDQSLMNRSGNDFNLDWNLMGPNNLGGRTRAILFDNRDASGNIVYAGSVLGGMFRSENGGKSWTKASEECGCLNVTCMTQAGNGDIYVGTGEAFGMQDYTILKEWGYTTGFYGKGIFKSTDGATFNLLPATKPTLNGDNELEWGFINEISAHPSNGALYASTNTGLKFSGDGGNSWQIAKTAEGTELNTKSQEVKMGSSGVVIAEVNNLCYVSADGNPNNFVLQSGDSAWNIPSANVGRIKFGIAPSNNDIIYALVITQGGALLNVYRTEDKGATWIIVGPGGSSNFNVFNTGSNISQGMGLFAASIEVYPNDPYHLLIGGQDMWEGQKIIEEGYYQWVLRSSAGYPWLFPMFLWQGHHIYKFFPGSSNTVLVGTNGGISMGTLDPSYFVFQFMNKDYIASQFYTVSTTMEKKNVLGGAQDIGTIFINGAANPADGKRGADIWTTQADFPDGKTGGYCESSLIYPTAVIYSRNPQPANSGNIETFVRRNEFSGGPDWAANMLNDKYSASGFIPPFALYESFEDYNSKDSAGYKVIKNIAAGSTIWIESNNGNRPFKYITPVDLQQGDSIVVPDIITARFFIGGDDRLMMSKQVIQFNKNPEWYVISDKSHQGVEGIPSCLALSSDANHIFVGTKTGKLYRVSNVKYAYNTQTADVNSPYCVISTKRIPVYLPGTSTEISQAITSISVDPNNDGRLLITLGNYGNNHYVYLSDNALSENPTFRSVQGNPDNGGLPEIPVYSSLIEMNPDNHLVFVGTEHGIYVTDNIGASSPTWVPENNNIGLIPVFMLKQQTVRKTNDTLMFVNIDTTYVVHYGTNNYGVIYGATYGRGLISLDEYQKPVGIGEPGKLDHYSSFSVYPNPATDKVTIAFEAAAPGYTDVAVFSLNGKLVKAVDLGLRPEGRHDVILNISGLPAGTYIVRLTQGSQVSSSKLVVY